MSVLTNITNAISGTTWTILDNDTFMPIVGNSIKPDINNNIINAVFRQSDLLIESIQSNMDSEITSYQVENGNFINVNKVSLPNKVTAKVLYSGGGLPFVRDSARQVLDKLVTLQKSTKLVIIETPKKIYRSMNLLSISYSESASSGAYMLIADLVFQEVRQVASLFSGSKTSSDVINPEHASKTDIGQAKTKDVLVSNILMSKK